MSARHIVIVGGGVAGHGAAMAAREADGEARIVLLSAEDALPYDRTTLSKQVLHEGVSPRARPLANAEAYRAARIEVRTATRVARIDPLARRVETDGAGALAYDALVLATGARPRRLEALEHGAPIHYLRWEPDALALRRRLLEARRVAVIGAGLIGLEVAAAAGALQRQVDVLEAAAGVLGRCCDPASAAAVERMHRAHGVRIHTGCRIDSIEARGQGIRIATGTHGALDVDLVLAGIGIVPDTALAQAAGVALQDGILVDAHGRTSAEGVYAAGDAARLPLALNSEPVRLENWRHAQDHGRAVGANAGGGARAYDTVPLYWSDQYGHRLQGVGLVPRAPARTVVRDYGDGTHASFLLDADARLQAACALDRGQDIMAARRLIGARVALDPAALADRAQPLMRLAKQITSQ